MPASTNSQRHSVLSVGGLAAASLASAMLVLALFPGIAAALTGGLSTNEPTTTGRLLAIEESDATRSVICRSAVNEASEAATCSSINAFGDGSAIAPGSSRATTMVFTNAGSAPASSFVVDAGNCSQVRSARSGSATDLCDLFSVKLTAAGKTIFDGSATEFGNAGAIDILGKAGIGQLAGGKSIAVTLTLRLAEATDNRYQGLRIVAPISWTLAA